MPDPPSARYLNSDFTGLIIEYERSEQVPDRLISCSGFTGSIPLEHFQNMNIAPDNVDIE